MWRAVVWRFVLGLLSASSATASLAGSSPTREELAVTRAKELGLARNPTWLKLGYYDETWLGGFESLVDSPQFFLAPGGKTSPEAELEATVRALFRADARGPEELQPQCRYPARTTWLRHALALTPADLQVKRCEDLESWLTMIDGERISLVFSSYFLNNPASMMGHTFLRIHRRASAGLSPALLDYAVNYAANPTTDNAVLYPLMGLAGMFQGSFSLTRYYAKVQEYSNHEARDLWEYELTLPPDRVDLILKSVWEMGPHAIDYYYFDENCSAIILRLLEIGAPERNLTAGFNVFVNPSDTVRAVTESAGLVRSVHYRPSSRTRFLTRFAELSPREARLTEHLARDQKEATDQKPWRALPADAQARILDAVVDYVDYQEKLAGTKTPERYAGLYTLALSERARLAIKPTTPTMRKTAERPDFGHWTSSVGLWGGQRSGEAAGFGRVELRPALHDLASPGIGYPDELSIHLARTRIRVDGRHSARLEELALIDILSLNLPKPMTMPWAWALEVGLSRPAPCAREGGCQRIRIAGGPGVSYAWFSERLIAYGVALGDVGVNPSGDLQWTAGIGARLGVATILSRSFRVVMTAEQLALADLGEDRAGDGRRRVEKRLGAQAAYALSPSWEARLAAEETSATREVSLGAYRYF